MADRQINKINKCLTYTNYVLPDVLGERRSSGFPFQETQTCSPDPDPHPDDDPDHEEDDHDDPTIPITRMITTIIDEKEPNALK